MKKFSILAISTLAVCAISSCGNQAPAPVPTWDADSISVMEEHLYGEVLPCYATGLTATYDQSNDRVTFKNDNVKATPTSLKAYADVFTQLEWVETTSEYSSYITGSFFAFETIVDDNGKQKYVEAKFWAVDTDGYATSEGIFVMVASDPYMYSWEEVNAEFAYYAKEAFNSEVTITPVDDAKVSKYWFSSGDWDEDYGFDEDYAYVLAYLSDNTYDFANEVKFDDYWNYVAGAEGEYDHAYSVDGRYSIEFGTSSAVLSITLSPTIISWPTEQLKEDLGEELAALIPSIAATSYEYSYGSISINASSLDIAAYQATLTNETYKFTLGGTDQYGDKYYYSEKHELYVSLYQYSGSYTLVFCPIEEWNNEKIASDLTTCGYEVTLPKIVSTQYDAEYMDYSTAEAGAEKYEVSLSTGSYDMSKGDAIYYASLFNESEWTKTKEEAEGEDYEGTFYEEGYIIIFVNKAETYQVTIYAEDYYILAYLTITVEPYTPAQA